MGVSSWWLLGPGRAAARYTFRPEFNPPWVGQSLVTSVTLSRLGEREAAAIIARLVGNKELPADVMAEIVERTDGIPLFVEEMTKAVLEAESEGEARQTAAVVPSPALAVPASLHASLMARLDRLGPAKATKPVTGQTRVRNRVTGQTRVKNRSQRDTFRFINPG